MLALFPPRSCFQHLNFKIWTRKLSNIRVVQGEICFMKVLVWRWDEGLMYNSACATANCQCYSSGLSGESQRTDEKQSWLQCRVKHDLGKSPAVTTYIHSVYYLWCVYGNMCTWWNMFKHSLNIQTSTCKYEHRKKDRDTWTHVLCVLCSICTHVLLHTLGVGVNLQKWNQNF